MNIITPVSKINVSNQKCGQRAAAAYLGKKRAGAAALKSCRIDVAGELSYVPYWIARIDTVKARAFPLYPDKKITFYLVCDGIDGEYIVLRNIPEVRNEDVAKNRLLPCRIPEDELAGRIVDEAIKTRINKQYIFGPPQITSRSQYLMYLPARCVRVGRGDAEDCRTFRVNVYTGEVKHCGPGAGGAV